MSENIKFVIAAYAVTWAFIIGFLIRLRSVMRAARTEYEEAARMTEESRA